MPIWTNIGQVAQQFGAYVLRGSSSASLLCCLRRSWIPPTLLASEDNGSFQEGGWGRNGVLNHTSLGMGCYAIATSSGLPGLGRRHNGGICALARPRCKGRRLQPKCIATAGQTISSRPPVRGSCSTMRRHRSCLATSPGHRRADMYSSAVSPRMAHHGSQGCEMQPGRLWASSGGQLRPTPERPDLATSKQTAFTTLSSQSMCERAGRARRPTRLRPWAHSSVQGTSKSTTILCVKWAETPRHPGRSDVCNKPLAEPICSAVAAPSLSTRPGGSQGAMTGMHGTTRRPLPRGALGDLGEALAAD